MVLSLYALSAIYTENCVVVPIFQQLKLNDRMALLLGFCLVYRLIPLASKSLQMDEEDIGVGHLDHHDQDHSGALYPYSITFNSLCRVIAFSHRKIYSNFCDLTSHYSNDLSQAIPRN